MIYLKIDLISMIAPPGPIKDDIDNLHDLLQEGIRISNQLIRKEKEEQLKASKVSIDTVAAMINVLGFTFVPPRIKFNSEFTTNCWVYVNTNDIKEVFRNLILNAIDAITNEGEVSISHICDIVDKKQLISGTTLEAGRYEIITFRDNGKGIGSENLYKIFDLYFSTKPHGSGFGLPAVKSKLNENNSHIDVQSKVGHGTQFTIYIPHPNEIN